MLRFLIDANLPYYFSVWRGPDYVHLRDLDDRWTDRQVWSYAKERSLTIVTKDTDFSDRMLLATPPPRVVHIRCGNMRMSEFHEVIASRWDSICSLSNACKLVQVFSDRIEGID